MGKVYRFLTLIYNPLTQFFGMYGRRGGKIAEVYIKMKKKSDVFLVITDGYN